MKRKLYIAAPLFSQAEKTFNKRLKKALSPYFDVYLPQEDGKLIVNMLKNGISFSAASKEIFKNDIETIRKTDILLIVLDGRNVDEGASVELGYAFCLGKQCIGYSTDPRTLLPDGQNPMISCCLETAVQNIKELLNYMHINAPQTVSVSAKRAKVYKT